MPDQSQPWGVRIAYADSVAEYTVMAVYADGAVQEGLRRYTADHLAIRNINSLHVWKQQHGTYAARISDV